MLWRIIYLKYVLGIILCTVCLEGVSAGKKKKVIIKVPTHVKHVYHHHLKTVHIQQPQPKPQHHVHHEHFEDVHNDRDDYRGKRQGKGFGSWRGLETDVERPRGYRSYSELMKERPPPAPAGSYDDYGDYRSADQDLRPPPGGWRPTGGARGWKSGSDFGKSGGSDFGKNGGDFGKGGGGDFGKSGWKSGGGTNKGVVYEQNHKNKWRTDDYDGPDLTYNTKGDYDYGRNNGGRGYRNNDYPLRDHRSYTDASSTNYRQAPKLEDPPHRYNTKNFESHEEDSPEVANHGSDTGKREVYVAPLKDFKQTTPKNKNVWKASTPSRSITPNNVWKPSSTQSSNPSVWPELKEHSSWTQNPAPATTLPPFNHINIDNHHSNPGSASSYVYHNFGSADAIVPQQAQGAASPTGNNGLQVTVKPLSSYQVQVNHYTEKSHRP